MLLMPSRYTKLIRQNSRILLVIFLLFEFSYQFLFKVHNSYSEMSRGIYLSEYKQREQLYLVRMINGKQQNFNYTQGYLPNTKKIIKNSFFSYEHHYNSLGLRGALPDKIRDSNELRIVVLGDSFAEGYGAPDDSTISVLLQNEIIKKYPDKKVNVINAGISGSNPLYEIQLCENKLMAYHPTHVILILYDNDINDMQKALWDRPYMPLYEYLYAVSHIFRIFYINMLGVDFVSNHSSYSLEQKRESILGVMKSYMLAFENGMKSKCSLYVTYIPPLSDFKEDILPYSNSLAIEKIMANSGLKFVNLKETLKDDSQLFDYYWVEDGHLNSYGNFMVSKELSKIEFYAGTN